jgi:hypothetical protein
MWASKKGYVGVVEALLIHGANVNEKNRVIMKRPIIE